MSHAVKIVSTSRLPLRPAQWILLLLVAFGSSAIAQPNLTFKRITVNGPTIELYSSISCDGNPAYHATLQHFRIFENGVEMAPSTLWCPDPIARCPVSVALVFDASVSMAGSGNAGAKQAGHAFADLMDGFVDEASVLWFSSVVTVMQSMTRDKTLLHSAVDVLPANGVTAAWDGAYAGLIEVINNGVNQCRAVILLTDGADEASTRTPDDVIALASRHRIRVFTIGLGMSIDATQLELIASSTGGKYYQTPNAGQLAAIYQEISTIMFLGWNECLITYHNGCADGTLRTVVLELKDFCGGSDAKFKTFRAPLDSSTFSTLHMELGSSVNGRGTNATIPLRLITPVNDAMFFPFRFTLEFDTALVELQHATTDPTHLLRGVPISWTPTASGATIQTAAPTLLSGSGTLMELNFRTKTSADSACTELKPVAASFEQGCFMPVIADGRICIQPDTPIITCEISGPSELLWMRGMRNYYPNPFTIGAHFSNTGDAEALQPRYRITYDSADVTLYSPKTDTKGGSTGVIATNSVEYVSWYIRAVHRSAGDTTRICITASFDNHPDVVCCQQVYIPMMEPLLDCQLFAPPITADSANLRYTPMPFTVTLAATNLGPSPTDSVWATIDVPMDLDLAGPDAPDSYTKLLFPATMAPLETASVSWQLQHPRSNTDREYLVSVLLNTANADSTRCSIGITIPGLPVSTFAFTLTALGPMVFCEGDSVVLDAGAGYTSYRWSDGSRDRLLTVKQRGNYFCKVEHGDGSIGFSDTVRVTVTWNPTPRIAVNGSIPMCEYDSVRLDAGGGYTSYLWNTGATEQVITVHSVGAYFVRVRSNYDCEGYSDTVLVTTKPIPSKPRIRRNLDWLIAESDIGGFYWYRDGVLLPDSGYGSIKLRETGRYQLRLRSMNGCSAMSDPFDVTVLDAEEVPPVADPAVLVAYPEPAENMLHIELGGTGAQTVTLALYDVLGRAKVIHSGVLEDGAAVFTHSLHGREAGVYYLVALLGKSVLVKRVTKL